MINYILGSVKLCVKNSKAIGLLAGRNISCTNVCSDAVGISFYIPLYSLGKARNILNGNNIEFEICGYYGLPKFIRYFRCRWGVIVGTAVFLFSISLSGDYIWSFNIKGNNSVSDDIILGVLDDLGCGIGSKIKAINFDELHNKFLIECNDIAWISVNMDGVVANVEVMEVKRSSKDENDNTNIVASENGQIELITIVNGKAQVEIGDVVKKGDLLISGVESYREGESTFYRNANGSVLARVNRIIKAEVNGQKKQRVQTGNFNERKTLKIFDLNINLFRKGGNLYDEYDIITENRQIVLFNAIELPIWINIERIYEIRSEVITLSDTELEAEAVRVYKNLLAEVSKDAELVSVKTKRYTDNGFYTIESNIYCITDIAEIAPYEIISEGQKED